MTELDADARHAGRTAGDERARRGGVVGRPAALPAVIHRDDSIEGPVRVGKAEAGAKYNQLRLVSLGHEIRRTLGWHVLRLADLDAMRPVADGEPHLVAPVDAVFCRGATHGVWLPSQSMHSV